MAVALCFFAGAGLVYAKSKDSQYADYVIVKKKLNNKLDLYFEAYFKFRDDMGTFYWSYIRNGFIYHTHKNLDLGLIYRWTETRVRKTTEVDWKIEQRAEFIVTPKINIGKLKVTDRNSLEYRYFENERYDKWRYRNALEFRYPVKIFNAPVSLFCSEELFYELNPKEINLHWLTAGFGKKITKDLNLDIFFRIELVRKAEGRDAWDRNNTLGTKFTWYFQ